jgi:hypothetical protein
LGISPVVRLFHAEDPVVMGVARLLTVNIDSNGRGTSDVVLPGQHGDVKCETFDDARQVAYVCAAHPHLCEVVVRDAYHRLLLREFVDGDGGAAALPWP